MSRIQDILSKAERDGTTHRTRGLAMEVGVPAVPPARHAVEPPRERPPHTPPDWAARAAIPAFEPDLTRGESATALDSRLVAALAPHSLAAEHYRSLRTRIKHAEQGRAVRAIVITSPAKGDGKSLTAANLALTMAQEFQQRVLLVDGDLRRPSIHHLFGLNDGPGLADVLMGAADLDQVLVTVPEHHLTILPAGAPPGHPAELLGSASMRRVLDTLRTRFDRILMDMPPVEPLADLSDRRPAWRTAC